MQVMYFLHDFKRLFGQCCCAVACFSGAWASPVFALTAQEVFNQVSDNVVEVEMLDDKSATFASSTGIVIGTGKVVVQCDVLQGAAAVRVTMNKQSFSAHKQGGRNSEGFCVLAVPDALASAASAIRQDDPEAGTRVFAISNALGLGLSISEGVISGIRSSRGETYLQFTAAIGPGSEGGGLFDANGKLLGFITYRQRDGQNVNFATPARRLAGIEKRLAAVSVADGLRDTAAVLMREGKWPALIQHAKNWIDSDPSTAEAWMWLGVAAQQTSDWPEAERAYRESLNREPESIHVGLGLSMALLSQRKFQDAADTARGLLVLRQEDARIWAILGIAEKGLDQVKQAKADLEHAVQLDSWNYEAQFGLAQIARREGDWRSAVAADRALTRIVPNDLNAWLQLADSYLYDHRPQRGLAAAEHALALAPDNEEAKRLKGAALAMAHRYREGIEILKKVAAAGGAPQAGIAWMNLGSAYSELHFNSEAINAYTQGLKAQPLSLSAKQRLGMALMNGLFFTEALAVFEELRIAQPNDPLIRMQLGLVYAEMMQPEKAISVFKESLQLNSKQPAVLDALAMCYQYLGRREEVKQTYEQLKLIDAQAAETLYKKMLLAYEGAP